MSSIIVPILYADKCMSYRINFFLFLLLRTFKTLYRRLNQPVAEAKKVKMKVKAPWPEVKGIFVHGCVARGEGSSFRAKAHAHNQTKDSNFGWICVRSASVERLGEIVYIGSNGFDAELIKPSLLMWHEYAHILTPNHGHDAKWREKMIELGQPLGSGPGRRYI